MDWDRGRISCHRRRRIRSLCFKSQFPDASLSCRGTLPMVPESPAKPPWRLPATLPVKRVALRMIGEVGRPSRAPTLLKLNCCPKSCPAAACTCSGELPIAPFSAGPLKRAAVRTLPLGCFETIAVPIGQTGSRVGPSLSVLNWSALKLTTTQEVPKAKLPPVPMWPPIGRRSIRTRPPGNGPSSCATVLMAVESPGPGPNWIGASDSR